MRSRDVVEIFEDVPLGTSVAIIAEKFPRFPKYTPPKPTILVSAPQPKPAPPALPPVISQAKKIAATTPKSATTVAQNTPTIPATPATKPEPAVPTAASLALQGSMLDAGLPQGPRIASLSKPIEPKETPSFSPL